MEVLLVWLLVGVVIGYVASVKRGYSPVAGALGGAALGILSPLLFAVSSVAKTDKTKACPHCAERIKDAATVCRFCSRDV